MNIRYVAAEDKDFWFQHDSHIRESEFTNKVQQKMGYIILENDIKVGLLRFNFFGIIYRFAPCFISAKIRKVKDTDGH